ncbi:peptidyl-prolyl cis-trans isomerase [Sphingorhabdus sp. Alg231-15]|uniref:peptidyl-prolyl cis-trans isomerase n=1 Tax=Sphingorhabdus sp. Alg231-15 TaxID=1922222 RepID=UPI000D554A6C
MKLLKEPLVHFLGGALLVFAFFWATGSNRDPADYEITISETDIKRIKAGWVQNFRRAPTQSELDGLIDREIREEIYYREALRLGLDRNDPVIRRRLFTKMRFLDNEEMLTTEPTDAVLQKWLDEHPKKYAQSSLYDLEQIYLGQPGMRDDARIAQLVDDLNQGIVQPDDAGRPISLPGQLRGADTADISRQFGEKFASSLTGLETDSWQGPVLSGFGLHLVKITDKKPGKAASLEDVRQRVTNDWRAAQTETQEKARLNRYQEQYDVTVVGRR